MVNRRYSYLPECKWLLEATDMHHVVVRKSKAKDFFVCLSALIVVANARRFDKSITNLLWGFLLSVLLVKVMFWNHVMKGKNCALCDLTSDNYVCFLYLFLCLNGRESVVVIPTFGVQLEAHDVRPCVMLLALKKVQTPGRMPTKEMRCTCKSAEYHLQKSKP
ncbi:hypothetical protein POTOM_024236 [Populus tomentosa]|uniref:Uncharacterized protein n=1 Tax=Populus tomentosa TaxID=118781 RepID=A0A8X7ZKY5_POPTO|nr:hypothetical protein POTOM_024236 [Populus tomentosa]